MKHKLSITLILLGMFLITQFIGLFVVNAFSENELPYGLETQEEDTAPNPISIIISFAFAFTLMFILMKYKVIMVIKIWFLLVVFLALAIAITAFLSYTPLVHAPILALGIALPLAIFKIFKPNVYVHNLTELLIYPGVAVVFVYNLVFNITPASIIVLLVLISLYDMWAVWKSGIMQKMAKFQMEEVKIFGGFLIPSISKKVKADIKNIQQKYKDKKIPKSVQEKKYRVNLAILGGGDIIFPIIASGVFLRTYGLIPALLIIFGALLGLSFLFTITKKGKAYPAMPYISVGIFIGMAIGKLFFF